MQVEIKIQKRQSAKDQHPEYLMTIKNYHGTSVQFALSLEQCSILKHLNFSVEKVKLEGAIMEFYD